MKTLLAAATAVLTALAVGAPRPAPASLRPDTYLVSAEPGVMPEGLTVTPAGTMYVTSSATGAVYRGDIRRDRLRPFLPAGSDGRTSAAGIRVDHRGRIFVAGWATGALFVYAPDGALLARRDAAPGAALNDLAVTADAVYVTDSATGTVWRAALDGGRVGALDPWVRPGDFPAAPVFLNGIVADPPGRLALVAEQGGERLYRVDLTTRSVTEVEVTGGRMGADGLLLEGNRLYGVVNEPDGVGGTQFVVNLARLDDGLRTARVLDRSRPVGTDRSPTSVARDAGRLLWVDSQLFAATPSPPFTVTEVPDLR
ncbi:SMP-30/gluconolactonase/LRE family protein [Micromonospora sp. RP3T]|uniref:SMP-30/gluconolactonase/LRE family protein n=1 Tax=Micromonospora sp. RP3T TaxID=2135446 RepID=UPI000D15A3F2|nr:SMP-30/gluconolactonase/LRE family protein [Micromonospora sp. RP3T]PTA46647.1 superoxide dismutase [Micromonospora sp. RP3T]